MDSLPIEIISYIISYTCLYISGQVCKCWKEIVYCNKYSPKLYITNMRLYNMYRYNKFVNVQDVILDCMLENSISSRKLLHLILKVDNRQIQSETYGKFFNSSDSFDIIDYVKSCQITNELHYETIARNNPKLEVVKYIINTIGDEVFQFKLDNEKCISYLEERGYYKKKFTKTYLMKRIKQ